MLNTVKDLLIDLGDENKLPIKKKLRGRQKTKRWNVKFHFNGNTLINEDFTTLHQISEKFNVSYNTLRSLSCGRCKQKNPLFKNLFLTKIN